MFAVISRSEPGSVGGARREPAAFDRALPRSTGRAELVLARRDGATRLARAFQDGAAKLRFPNVPAGRPPEAVLLNIAGGMAGGDRQEISVRMEEGAEGTVTTQACERVYLSLGEDSVMSAQLELEAGSRLEWLPQPLILFDRARLKREMRVRLAPDAVLLAVEAVIFGRIASGETVEYGAISDSWLIRRGGRLIHGERFEAAGPIGTMLKGPFVLGGHRAMAAIRYVAPDAEARLPEMRTLLEGCGVEAAASAWNGLMLARLLGPDGYSLTRALTRVLGAFRNHAMPRAWMI